LLQYTAGSSPLFLKKRERETEEIENQQERENEKNGKKSGNMGTFSKAFLLLKIFGLYPRYGLNCCLTLCFCPDSRSGKNCVFCPEGKNLCFFVPIGKNFLGEKFVFFWPGQAVLSNAF
jgi:hypothetical protein